MPYSKNEAVNGIVNWMDSNKIIKQSNAFTLIPGEQRLDSADYVQLEGLDGRLQITTLRIMWSSKASKKYVSIGLGAISTLKLADPSAGDTMVTVPTLTATSNSGIVVVFECRVDDANAVSHVLGCFAVAERSLKAFEDTSGFRNLMVFNGSKMEAFKKPLVHSVGGKKAVSLFLGEEIQQNWSGVFHLENKAGILGSMWLTNVRIVWADERYEAESTHNMSTQQMLSSHLAISTKKPRRSSQNSLLRDNKNRTSMEATRAFSIPLIAMSTIEVQKSNHIVTIQLHVFTRQEPFVVQIGQLDNRGVGLTSLSALIEYTNKVAYLLRQALESSKTQPILGPELAIQHKVGHLAVCDPVEEMLEIVKLENSGFNCYPFLNGNVEMVSSNSERWALYNGKKCIHNVGLPAFPVGAASIITNEERVVAIAASHYIFFYKDGAINHQFTSPLNGTIFCLSGSKLEGSVVPLLITFGHLNPAAVMVQFSAFMCEPFRVTALEVYDDVSRNVDELIQIETTERSSFLLATLNFLSLAGWSAAEKDPAKPAICEIHQPSEAKVLVQLCNYPDGVVDSINCIQKFFELSALRRAVMFLDFGFISGPHNKLVIEAQEKWEQRLVVVNEYQEVGPAVNACLLQISTAMKSDGVPKSYNGCLEGSFRFTILNHKKTIISSFALSSKPTSIAVGRHCCTAVVCMDGSLHAGWPDRKVAIHHKCWGDEVEQESIQEDENGSPQKIEEVLPVMIQPLNDDVGSEIDRFATVGQLGNFEGFLSVHEFDHRRAGYTRLQSHRFPRPVGSVCSLSDNKMLISLVGGEVRLVGEYGTLHIFAETLIPKTFSRWSHQLASGPFGDFEHCVAVVSDEGAPRIFAIPDIVQHKIEHPFADSGMGWCSIEDVGKYWARCHKLTTIDLSRTNLDDLQCDTVVQQLHSIPSLTKLDLSHNFLTRLSPALAQCLSLRELMLEPQFQLNKETKEVFPSTALKNSLPDGGKIPIENLLQYLRDMEMEGAKKNEILRLMVVGLGEVGKTSLINALLSRDSISEAIAPDNRTVGIDMSDLRVQYKGNTVHFRVCDFAGQKVYYPTHQFFLSQRCLYLLVWRVLRALDSSDYGPEDVCGHCSEVLSGVVYCVGGQGTVHEKCVSYDALVKQWLEALEFRVPGAKVVLVATHCDGTDEQDVLRQCHRVRAVVQATLEQSSLSLKRQRQAISEIAQAAINAGGVVPPEVRKRATQLDACEVVDVTDGGMSFRVSSITGQGISDLRMHLAQKAAEMPLYGQKIPASYEKLRQWIAGCNRAWITWQQFNQELSNVLTSSALASALQTETAAALLNDLGDIVHFEGEGELKDTVVVDPKWLVNVFKGLVCHDHETAGVASDAAERDPVIKRGLRKLQRSGVMSKQLLTHLWANLVKEMDFDRIIQLLQAFDIVMQDDDGSLLVPCLLRGARNRSIQIPNSVNGGDSKLRRARFVYQALPDGFFFRLVVRCKRVLGARNVKFTEGMGTLFIRGRRVVLSVSTINHPASFFCPEQGEVLRSRGAQVHLTIAAEGLRELRQFVEQVGKLEEAYPGLVRLASLVPCPCCSKNKIGYFFDFDVAVHAFNLASEHEMGPREEKEDVFSDEEDEAAATPGTWGLDKISEENSPSILRSSSSSVFMRTDGSTMMSNGGNDDNYQRKDDTNFGTSLRCLVSSKWLLGTEILTADPADVIVSSHPLQPMEATITKWLAKQDLAVGKVGAGTLQSCAVVLVLLDEEYVMSAACRNECAKAAQSGKPLIPIITPEYRELQFPRWWPREIPSLEGMLFIDMKSAMLGSEELPYAKLLESQVEKFLEERKSTMLDQNGSGKNNVMSTMGAGDDEYGGQPGMLVDLVPCPSCGKKGISPPYLFRRLDLISDLRDGARTAICEEESTEVVISDIIPAEVFLSYSWGKRLANGDYETQQIVLQAKECVEASSDIVCWMDVERMGGGQLLEAEMESGVRQAAVTVIFLDGNYAASANCQKEFKFALFYAKPIVPILLPWYRPDGEDWYPAHMFALAQFEPLFVPDRRKSEAEWQECLEELSKRICSRFQRDPRSSEPRPMQMLHMDTIHEGWLRTQKGRFGFRNRVWGRVTTTTLDWEKKEAVVTAEGGSGGSGGASGIQQRQKRSHKKYVKTTLVGSLHLSTVVDVSLGKHGPNHHFIVTCTKTKPSMSSSSSSSVTSNGNSAGGGGPSSQALLSSSSSSLRRSSSSSVASSEKFDVTVFEAPSLSEAERWVNCIRSASNDIKERIKLLSEGGGDNLGNPNNSNSSSSSASGNKKQQSFLFDHDENDQNKKSKTCMIQ